jgi:hypothetical protein
MSVLNFASPCHTQFLTGLATFPHTNFFSFFDIFFLLFVSFEFFNSLMFHNPKGLAQVVRALVFVVVP